MDNKDISIQCEVPPKKDGPELGEECEAKTSNSPCEGDAGEGAVPEQTEKDLLQSIILMCDEDSEDLLLLYTALFAAVVTARATLLLGLEENLPQTRAVSVIQDGCYPDNGLMEKACRFMLGELRKTLSAQKVRKIVNGLREEAAVDRALTRHLHAELRELETLRQRPSWWRTTVEVLKCLAVVIIILGSGFLIFSGDGSECEE